MIYHLYFSFLLPRHPGETKGGHVHRLDTFIPVSPIFLYSMVIIYINLSLQNYKFKLGVFLLFIDLKMYFIDIFSNFTSKSS